MSAAAPGGSRPALVLLEEALALLRRCPATAWLEYGVGTVPFVLGFLYFWAEMSGGAYAPRRLPGWSLLLAAGFLWCKWWQARFGMHLLATARRRELPAGGWARHGAVFLAQAPVQVSGLFLLPVAFLLTVPFCFVYAFYQNCTVLALDEAGAPLSGSALRAEASAQARRWAGSMHRSLLLLSAFGLCVFVNILMATLLLPQLLQTLLGVETRFARDLFSLLNTTLLATSTGLTYLCLDPVVKAFFALRCFHGRALLTGEDLLAELRLLPRSTGAVAAVFLGLLLLSPSASASLRPEPPAAPGAAEIDRAVEGVLERPEFSWREPRRPSAEEQGPLGSFAASVVKTIRRVQRAVFEKVVDFLMWLRRKQRPPEDRPSSAGSASLWQENLRLLAWGFCGLATVALAWLFWKAWRGRRRTGYQAASAAAAWPDLNAEEVTADLLPEDGWEQMAEELRARGELRLALRALYLASLAHLGEREAIILARHKSNRDYQRELRRRRPAQGSLQEAFAATLSAFDRAWYGQHEVTGEILDHSRARLASIRQG